MADGKTRQAIGTVLVLGGLAMALHGVFGPAPAGQFSVAGVPVSLIAGIVLLMLGAQLVKDSWRNPRVTGAASGPAVGGQMDAVILLLIVLPVLYVMLFAFTRSPVAVFYGLAHGGLEYMWPALLMLLLAVAVLIGFIVLLARHGRNLPRVAVDAVARHRRTAVIVLCVVYIGVLMLFAPSLFGTR